MKGWILLVVVMAGGLIWHYQFAPPMVGNGKSEFQMEQELKYEMRNMDFFQKANYLGTLMEDTTAKMGEFSKGIKQANQEFKDLAKEEGMKDLEELFNDPNDPMNQMEEFDKTVAEVEANGKELVNDFKNKKPKE